MAQFILLPALARVRMVAIRMVCLTNLSALGKDMLIYAYDYEDKLPTANKWCDLLIKWEEVSPKRFQCRGAVEGTCHYALNKHATELKMDTENSDVVLLFEAHDGWNQVGGPELLTTDHHQGEGCNVLFMDSHVEFVRSSQIPDLRWK
jgi:prepilin-type processing-associated H-X9-DG protein